MTKNKKMAYLYEEGDLVAIARTQFGPGLKWYPKFLGPYEVVKVKRNNRYEVKKIGFHEGPNITSTASDYMKLWHSDINKDEKTDNDSTDLH